MDITQLPYNKFIGIKRAQSSEYILELEDSQNYLNHLGNVHASAQISLAEAASGEFLIQLFTNIPDQYVPVVRRLEAKFRKPANGKIFARLKTTAEMIRESISELHLKGRSLISIEVDIEDIRKTVTMNNVIVWYVQKLHGEG